MEILQGFVAFEEMDNVARYLQAGRQFAGLTYLTLQQAWLDEWCIYNSTRHRAAQWTRCMDIEAELTLRGLAPPEDQVPSWFLERLADSSFRNARRPDIVWWVKLKIEDFLRQCAAQRN
jgi:hypothetical protein